MGLFRRRPQQEPVTDPVVLSTERDGLFLREFVDHDDDRALFEAAHRNDAHIRKGGSRIFVGECSSVDGIGVHRRTRQAGRPEWREMMFGVYKQERLVGAVALTHTNKVVSAMYGPSPDWAIDYWVDRAHAGQGIGTVIVGTTCQYLFEQRGARTIHADVWHENNPSLRIVEHWGFERAPSGKTMLSFELAAARWAQVRAGEFAPMVDGAGVPAPLRAVPPVAPRG